MRRHVVGVAMATAGVLAATACASSTGGHPLGVGGHGVPNPTSTAHPFPSQPSSSSQPAKGGGLTDQEAQAALLTAAEVGGGFTTQPPNNKSAPLPCDQQAPPLDQQFHPIAKARTDMLSPDGQAYLSEEVIGYDSVATTNQALAAGEKGLSCHTATVNVNGKPTRYTIFPVQDETAALAQNLHIRVDKALLWTVHTNVVNIALLANKIGAQLVVLTFGISPQANTTNLPNRDAIIATALKKAKAHI